MVTPSKAELAVCRDCTRDTYVRNDMVKTQSRPQTAMVAKAIVVRTDRLYVRAVPRQLKTDNIFRSMVERAVGKPLVAGSSPAYVH